MNAADTEKDLRYFDAAPGKVEAEALLEELAQTPPYRAPQSVTKPLYLYGAGSLGRMARDYCAQVGLTVEGVIDRHAARYKDDPYWTGVRMMSPEEVGDAVKKDALLAISIVTSPWGQVTRPLRESGWQNILPFYTLCTIYRTLHPLDNGWLSGPLDGEDVRNMKEVLDRYADDVSRAHHLQFAAWHGLQHEWIFAGAPIDTANRYFIPEVLSSLHDREYFLDLGAHHGHVVQRFLDIVANRFAGVLAVEADEANAAEFENYRASLAPEIRDKIVCLRKVLGRGKGKALFRSGLDYVSRIVADGGEEKETDTLDNLNTRPTFIKAHLEGSELDVLMGGIETMRKYRPLVALTVYHDRAGLWQTAMRLAHALPDLGYRSYFRLHGWQGTGAVLYLIPEHR